MSTRNNPARFDPVVKVTPQEAAHNKRAMGKSEAAHQDPRGEDHTIAQSPIEETDADGRPAAKADDT